jgi:Metal-dependent hydrolase
MDIPQPSQPTVSRRTLLGSVVGLTAGIGHVSRVATASSRTTLTAMTKNVYLGLDLSRLLQTDSSFEFYALIGQFLTDIDPAVYEARADGIAAEIDAAGADVVGLQEAGIIRTERPTETGTQSTRLDFLARIRSALEKRDLSYRVAVKTVTTDIELATETADGAITLSLADRDVLLVRDGIDVTATTADTYDETVELEVPENTQRVTLNRGYCLAEIRVDGVDLTTVSTHLESTERDARARQTEELLSVLPTDRPVVLCGDFNSGPGAATETYDQLTEALDDPYPSLRSGEDGATCCQAADLRNTDSQLDQRIDGVLHRGDLDPTAVDRVGHRPDDRVSIQSDGETVRLWPSDHAGVVATFELPAGMDSATTEKNLGKNESPSTSANRTEINRNKTGTNNQTESAAESETPGFGVVSTLAALGGIGYLLNRRRDL